jgi:hypothetical protein
MFAKLICAASGKLDGPFSTDALETLSRRIAVTALNVSPRKNSPGTTRARTFKASRHPPAHTPRVWTVKLYLAPGHALNRHRLFRRVRHPNYFLNVLPELIGLALAFHAVATTVTVLPLYLVSLGIRIAQEEQVMRRRFPDYRLASDRQRPAYRDL